MISLQQFYYVRHGKTDWNGQGRLQGNTDVPLNDTGIAQAQTLRKKLTGLRIATICCSPLTRARQTADILNAVLDCPIIEINDLRECNFGPHEGKTRPDWVSEWLAGETARVPDGVEPYDAFIKRTSAAINRALTHDGPVLVVAHGGTYMPINQILPRTQRWDLPNCRLVRHDPPQDPGGAWDATCL